MAEPSSTREPSEGVIRFDLRHTMTPTIDPPERQILEGWRAVLRRCGVLGQDPGRYDGFGFGNVSHRLPPWDGAIGARRFLVSGTQTGHLERLGPDHWAEVVAWRTRQHRVDARGPVRPSSESTTHAAIYDASPSVRAVFHVHSPDLWHAGSRLDLPTTPEDADYGTTAMADAVTEVVMRRGKARGLVVMAGHEDGLLAYGPDADAAGAVLLTALARALGPSGDRA